MRAYAYQEKRSFPGLRFVIRRIFKWVGMGVVCLAVVVFSFALLYRKYLQHKVVEERAITSPTGINSLDPVRIGGIDEWVEVRGQNLNNPILLVIHGGPGIAFIPLARSFQGPWENRFTVVEWDQRGAGKTYASNDKDLQRRTMHVPQMEQDTLDVANYLRHKFQRKKIFVMGHSWGSLLGLWLAHEHPELIYAYVGVGQVVNPKQNDEVAYRDALQEARSTRNQQAVRDLESNAPSTNVDLRKGQTTENWQAALLGPPSNGAAFMNIRSVLSDLVSAPEYSLVDDFSFPRGQLLSLEILIPQARKVDLTQLGSDFRVPIFFFEGRHDPYARPSLIWSYYQTIKAPHKEFVWFESSGHFPFFEENQKFADELFQRVLPLAIDR
jgi:proline iminopeptidase